MQKIADYIAPFPGKDSAHGPYRLRVYEDDGRLPAVVITNPTPDEAPTPWLSANAPRLAAHVLHKDLPQHDGLRWITPYAGAAQGQELFESSAFAVIADGQVAYRERPRQGEQPPEESQAALLDREAIEALLGQPLDG